MKQTAFEITVYLTHSSTEYCYPSDGHKRDTLLQIKRDSMIVLLKLVRTENYKNGLSSLRTWMEGSPHFLMFENKKFIKDMILFLHVNLCKEKLFLQKRGKSENFLTLQNIVQKLNDTMINTAYVHLLHIIGLPQFVEIQKPQSMVGRKEHAPSQTG